MSESKNLNRMFEMPKEGTVRFLDLELRTQHWINADATAPKLEDCPYHNAPTKLRSLVNGIIKKRFAVPIPKRKKKSWLRHSSQKKWARTFPKRFTYTKTIGVLALSSELSQKIVDLAARKPALSKLKVRGLTG